MTEHAAPPKKRIFDNPLFILVAAYLILSCGQSLGLVLIPLLSRGLDLINPAITASDVWSTGSVYLYFIGIWIAALAVIALFPGNRPMLKTLWTGIKGNTPRQFALGLAIGMGMNLLCAVTAMLSGDIVLTFSSFRPVALLLVFIAVLIQSAAEELICRVYIYQRFVRRYGKPLVAAIVNAVFFAVIHLGNPGISGMAVLNILLSGLVFSAMVVYMDSVWAAMAAHAGWNFCQAILLGLPNSGIVTPFSLFRLDAAAAADSFAYSTAFGLEGTVTACAVLFAATVLIVLWGKRRKVEPTQIWNA